MNIINNFLEACRTSALPLAPSYYLEINMKALRFSRIVFHNRVYVALIITLIMNLVKDITNCGETLTSRRSHVLFRIQEYDIARFRLLAETASRILSDRITSG